MRLAINYTDGVSKATNVFHFLCHETGGLGSTDVDGMVTALEGFWINDCWKQKASHLWHVVDYDAVYALIEGQPNVHRTHLADATAGLGSGASDTSNVCYLINWATGDARRGGKPRTYMCGFDEGDNADSANIVSSVISTFNPRIVTFLGHVQGHTSGALVCDQLVEYSTVLHNAYRAAGVTFNITAGSMNTVVASQRRRVDRVRSA
jgi:hypothetical protein